MPPIYCFHISCLGAPPLAEVTRLWEVATVVEATCIAAMLAIETSAWEASAVREALERMSRAEVAYAVALASAHEEAEGLIWKIVLLEGELVVDR
jgi:hypothetical protein